MKYVIFEQERTGLKMPVLFPDHVTHSSITIEGSKPISAGFCLVGGCEIITILPEGSDSLKLEPGEHDRELIISTLSNAGVYAFLNMELMTKNCDRTKKESRR